MGYGYIDDIALLALDIYIFGMKCYIYKKSGHFEYS